MSAFRFAARSLARAPTFTIATVATIALGLGAGCAVFGLLDAILLRPLPYPQSERLAGLWHSLPAAGIQTAKLAPGTSLAYRDAKSFEEIGVYVSLAATLTYRSPDLQPERVRAAWTTPSTFLVLGAKPLIGRLLTADD